MRSDPYLPLNQGGPCGAQEDRKEEVTWEYRVEGEKEGPAGFLGEAGALPGRKGRGGGVGGKSSLAKPEDDAVGMTLLTNEETKSAYLSVCVCVY